MKKSITASELLLFLSTANQEIGKLETENSYKENEISRLGNERHKAYSDIADLEHELELRDAIVRNFFGFELKRMISSGQNTSFTDMALRIIKLGIKNKILDIVSNLSNDIIVNHEMYSEFMRGTPDLIPGNPASEQPEETMNKINLIMASVKAMMAPRDVDSLEAIIEEAIAEGEIRDNSNTVCTINSLRGYYLR